MLIKDGLHTATRGLLANKGRSMLTILGIVIGITGIILVVSLGSSAEDIIVGELGGLGANTVVVRPGQEPKGPTDIAQVLFNDSLKERELRALQNKQNVPDLIAAAPEVFINGSVAYRGETSQPTIFGFSAEFMIETLGIGIAEGLPFYQQDIAANARVAIIGEDVREELFGEQSAIGKFIDVKGTKFRVVGVFEPRGQVVFFNVDELVLVPYSTALQVLSGNNYYNQIILSAKNSEVVDRMVGDVTRTLRDLHNIRDPEDDDFSVQTQQGLVEQVGTIIGTFTAFLSVVIAISLVVGGIGIMNIMLVSVTERTPEIGLRKSLGATRKDIIEQFMIEAVLLTMMGGIIGVIFGFLLSWAGTLLIVQTTGIAIAFSFSYGAAILGVLISGAVGIVFGLYPALKASKKSPIDALRYE